MDSSFQLMIAYDMFYYVKFTALSIKTICRALSLLVLKILAVGMYRIVILPDNRIPDILLTETKPDSRIPDIL